MSARVRSAFSPAFVCVCLCACSDEAATPPAVGPTGSIAIAIEEPASDGSPVCASLGQDADAHFPLLVDVDEVQLRPPGQCLYAQCGHLALYADGVLNNETAVPAVDLLARKLADPYHDGSEHGDGSGADVLTLTVEVIGPDGEPLCGNPLGDLGNCGETEELIGCQEIGGYLVNCTENDIPNVPIRASIDLITVPDCSAL